MAHRWIPGALALGLMASPAFAGSAEDDLAVVKKAVGPSARPAPRAESRPPEPTEARKDEPRWLKVRITDRGEKKGKVSINLPLDLVRALDEDDHVGELLHSVNGKGASMRLGDVLRALRTGQDIVEIEDAEATVRIWVE